MLQRMTNLKQNKDFVCLTWALRPGVTVCRVSSASWRFKFLLEKGEEEGFIHHVTDVLLPFGFAPENVVCVCQCACTPLSCLRWVSIECNRSMRLDTPCSRLSRVWCWGSWPEKLSLKLRSASLTSCSSSPCDKHHPDTQTGSINVILFFKTKARRMNTCFHYLQVKIMRFYDNNMIVVTK